MATAKIRKKKVSQIDIAKAAGVSQPVVSAALNGSGSIGVSEATLNRVRLIAADLGYEARVGRREADPTAVVLVQNSRDIAKTSQWMPFSYTLFYMRYVDGLLTALKDSGLHLTIKSPDASGDFEREVLETKPAAIFWKGGHGIDKSRLLALKEKCPVIGISIDAPPGIDAVDVDQERVMHIACEHLRELGHRRIAYAGGDRGHARIRRKAIANYAEEHDLPPVERFMVQADSTVPKGKLILDEWERLGDKAPTSLVMADFYALKVLDEAVSRGVRIPEDLSIVGIDNTPDCETSHPRLTSVDQPIEDVCAAAVELLKQKRERGDGGAKSRIQLEPSLVRRASCGPPPGA